MAELADYLRGTYKDDKRQIRTLHEIVAEVIPVFYNFWDDRKETWPYAVSVDSNQAKDLSLSTHSMILFTLEVASSPSASTALIPTPKQPPNLKSFKVDLESLSAKADAARKALITNLKTANKRSEAPLIHSNTFGDDDPLTLTWLLELALRWKARADKDVTEISEPLMQAAQRACERCRSKSGPILDLPKDAPRQEIRQSFLNVRGNLLAKAARKFGASELIDPSPLETFESAIEQQLAYSAIPDSRFDPAELTFALEGALQTDKNALSETTLNCIFNRLGESQERDPYWRPVMPFISTEQGMVLFPVSVEVANSLLRSCEILDEKQEPLYFSRFEPQFRRYSAWLQARIERGIFNKRKKFVGWHSEHVNERGTIHLWETSQVLLFLIHYAAILQRKVSADGLAAAGLIPGPPKKRLDTYWNDEPCKGFDEQSSYRVLSHIKKRYLDKEGGAKNGSILLYGPPGTGKTTLAEQMAVYLDRPLLIITVSDFLAGGSAEVEARAKGIFQVLNEQENVIILFDEIDQFLLDRNSEAYKKQTGIFQFMTPGMLTKMQDLKDHERSIFIIATNYEERIDSAIKRQGRIDDRMLLTIPNVSQRLELLFRFFVDRFHNEFKKALDGDNKRKEKLEKLRRQFNDLVKNDNNNLGHKTIFFGYGDLKYLVEQFEVKNTAAPAALAAGAAQGEEDRTKVALGALVAGIAQYRERVKPALSLNDYETRFDKDGEQKPFEEFFLLVYLLAELDKAPSEKERGVIKKALDCLGGQEKLETDKIIKDECIAATLIAKLKTWGEWT